MSNTTSKAKQAHFARPALAEKLADELVGDSVLSDASNGLFLAGPRRTGKSEFLKNDLKLALEQRGLLVMYVDLWSDKARPPGELIAKVVGDAYRSHLGKISKAAMEVGLDQVTVAGVKVNLNQIGKVDGLTLAEALKLLHTQAKKRLVLIVDEAQHALTTEDGLNAMVALKSARDQLKESGQSQLLLVMSGSHKDKLARLVNSVTAPFWGSSVDNLPTLGEAFARHICLTLKREKPELLSLQDAAVIEAFTHCGERPQFLFKIIKEANAASPTPTEFGAQLIALAKQSQQQDRDQFVQQFAALTKEQQTVLSLLLEKGGGFAPFDQAAMTHYAQVLGAPLTASNVQVILDSMQKQDSPAEPPLIWKSARGRYELYDQTLADVYGYLKAAGQWPPTQ